MSCPVFESLKKGDQFPVSMLLNEHDAVLQYWDWWWSTAPTDRLTRPHTVTEGDPWLTPTHTKATVDTETHSEYLSEFTLNLAKRQLIPRGVAVPRADYRAALVAEVVSKAPQEATPTVVLTGGGYGAGKTTAMDFMMRCRKIPIHLGSLTGVDNFKLFLPEYALLQRLAEGEASTVVQEEARMLADNTFRQMVAEKRSFGWDSSMSNSADSLARINLARESGYKLIMVAVFAPLEVAIRQAMSRARQNRRFAHPDYLPKSHTDFRAHFMSYVSFFDEVFAFCNDGKLNNSNQPDMTFTAQKVAGETSLAILNQTSFDSLVAQ